MFTVDTVAKIAVNIHNGVCHPKRVLWLNKTHHIGQPRKSIFVIMGHAHAATGQDIKANVMIRRVKQGRQTKVL